MNIPSYHQLCSVSSIFSLLLLSVQSVNFNIELETTSKPIEKKDHRLKIVTKQTNKQIEPQLHCQNSLYVQTQI